jgi:hypothetical protein
MGSKVTALIGIVILIVIGFALWPLIGTGVTSMIDPNDTAYVGATAAPLVGMIPIFYFLGLALAVIGMSIITLKEAEA